MFILKYKRGRNEQLVQGLTGGKPVSEMVIEDRGPY
jgi:hypothetical protein